MFHDKNIQFLSTQSKSNICKLISDIKSRPCCIALGAGASASVELPTWDKLLSRICYCYFWQWAIEISNQKALPQIPPSNVSIALTMGYDMYMMEKQHPDLVAELAEALKNAEYWVDGKKLSEEATQKQNEQQIKSDNFRRQIEDDFMEKIMLGDLTVIAQIIKNQVRPKDWNYLIRKSLYASYEEDTYELEVSPLYQQLINFVAKCGVHSIINYNYDDTFFHSLKENGIEFVNSYNDSQTQKTNKIFYPHGYIPMKGGVLTEIVLTEDDYQNQIYKQNLWSNNIQTALFTTNTCVFVGLSLNDSNIRRLVNMCSTARQGYHYAFLPSSGSDNASVMFDSLFDSDLYRLGIRVIRYPAENNHYQLTNLFKFICDNL